MKPTYIQKLLHSKGNRKTTNKLGDNICINIVLALCKWCDEQSIILWSLQTAHDNQHHQNKQLNLKMDRRPK